MQEEDMYLQQSVSEPEDIENNDFSVFLSQPGQKQTQNRIVSIMQNIKQNNESLKIPKPTSQNTS